MVLEELVEVRLDIQEVLNETKSEIERIKSKIEVLEEEKEININEVSQVLTLCSDLADQYEKLSPSNQRKLIMTAFKRRSPRKGKTKEAEFNSIDIAWTEPFQILHKKWFSKIWKEDKKKRWKHGGRGGKAEIIEMEMSKPSFLNLNNLLIKFKVAEELKQILATC